MKKIIMLIAMFAIAGAATAGLITDSGLDGALVDVSNIGDFDEYYEQPEYAGQQWVMDSGVSDSGSYFTINTSSTRAFGIVIDDNEATSGTSWSMTVDLNDLGGTMNDTQSVTLRVFGMGDPWSTQSWDNRILGQGWAAPTGTTILGEVVVAQSSISNDGWSTHTMDLDFDGSSYEYIGVAVVGHGALTLGVDNVDIVPEPATVGLLGLGALIALMVRRIRA